MDSSNSRRLTGFCHTEDVSADTQQSDEEDSVAPSCDTFSSASLDDSLSCTSEIQDEEYTSCTNDLEYGNQHAGNELVGQLTSSYHIYSHT